MTSGALLTLNRPTTTSAFFLVLAKIWYVAVSVIREASMASWYTEITARFSWPGAWG